MGGAKLKLAKVVYEGGGVVNNGGAGLVRDRQHAKHGPAGECDAAGNKLFRLDAYLPVRIRHSRATKAAGMLLKTTARF
jgi:hypothetical protein